jgi:hypothetical protein
MKSCIQMLNMVVALVVFRNIQPEDTALDGQTAPKSPITQNIIIAGTTPSGIAVAKSDKKVIILEQPSVIGGVLSSVIMRLDDYYLVSNSGAIESNGSVNITAVSWPIIRN